MALERTGSEVASGSAHGYHLPSGRFPDLTIGTGHALAFATGSATGAAIGRGPGRAMRFPIVSPPARPCAVPTRPRSAGLCVLVLLVALASQMALPAVHAWRVGESAVETASVFGADPAAASPVGAGGNEGSVSPAFSRAAAPATAHDPATCAVCQMLRDVSRAAPTPVALSVPLLSSGAMLAASTPPTRGRRIPSDHPPRAPPV